MGVSRWNSMRAMVSCARQPSSTDFNHRAQNIAIVTGSFLDAPYTAPVLTPRELHKHGHTLLGTS